MEESVSVKRSLRTNARSVCVRIVIRNNLWLKKESVLKSVGSFCVWYGFS